MSQESVQTKDEFEESRIFLELCYFTVSLISENTNPLDFFKSDFIVLMTPIIKMFVSKFPGQTERQILCNAAYKHLVQTYVQKMKPIIDAIKQSGLWIPQGQSSGSSDATDMISQVLSSDNADVEQLFILRSIKTNNLLYNPELTLYYNACLMCCQSQIIIVRLYSYSLLRQAPDIVDLRHLFNVFKEAMGYWKKGPVSFEFCASLYLLLQRLSEHRPSPNDANEFNLIVSIIENIHNSQNFETLMCFDTSLRWMYSIFSNDNLNHVLSNALESLNQGHSGDFCIICHCLSLGIAKPEIFPEAVGAALRSVACWANPIQREARSALAALPLHSNLLISEGVIDIIATVLAQPAHVSEPALFIFAEFLSSYYLGTLSSLHVGLLKALFGVLKQNEGKKNLPRDVSNIIIAICSNPVRLLEVISTASESRQLILAIITGVDKWNNSLMTSLAASPTYMILSEADAKAATKQLREKSLLTDEKVERKTFSKRLNLDLPLLVSIFPTELRKLVEKLNETVDEDLKFLIIELYTIVATQGRIPSECKDMLQFLPKIEYKCEYSDLISIIKSSTEKTKSPFEELASHIDDSLSQFLVVGSASHTAASLLFEHVIWKEGGEPLVVCKRLQLKPACWFASVLASLFTSIVADPSEGLVDLIDGAQKSPEFLVWIGYILFLRIIPQLKDALTNESFDTIPKKLLYPQISFKPTKEEKDKMGELQKKYKQTLQILFDVIVGSTKR